MPGVGAPDTSGASPEIDAPANYDSVEASTPDAFAGTDTCSDWETPTPTTGFSVVVCNQGALTASLQAANSNDSDAARSAVIRPSVVTASSQPTALGAPAYVTEPDAQTLESDLSVDNGRPSDVYVSSSRDTAQGAVRYQALFSGVSSPTRGLHVDATGSTWTLTDSTER